MVALILGSTVFVITWLFAWLKIDFAIDRLSNIDYERLLSGFLIRDIRFGSTYVLIILVTFTVFVNFPTIPYGIKLGAVGGFLMIIAGKFYASLVRIRDLELGSDLRRAVITGFSALIAAYCFLLFMLNDVVLTIRIWR